MIPRSEIPQFTYKKIFALEKRGNAWARRVQINLDLLNEEFLGCSKKKIMEASGFFQIRLD